MMRTPGCHTHTKVLVMITVLMSQTGDLPDDHQIDAMRHFYESSSDKIISMTSSLYRWGSW
jgi:hypothetical protein